MSGAVRSCAVLLFPSLLLLCTGPAEEVLYSVLAHTRVQLHQSAGDNHPGLCAGNIVLEDWPQKVGMQSVSCP